MTEKEMKDKMTKAADIKVFFLPDTDQTAGEPTALCIGLEDQDGGWTLHNYDIADITPDLIELAIENGTYLRPLYITCANKMTPELVVLAVKKYDDLEILYKSANVEMKMIMKEMGCGF